MIPACFLGGAGFCLLCDLIARTVFAPTELSISTVTALFGAPVVIYIMVHRKSSRGVSLRPHAEGVGANPWLGDKRIDTKVSILLELQFPIVR